MPASDGVVTHYFVASDDRERPYPFGPADLVEFFRLYYGPATRAFATLGEAEQAALRAELVQLWSAHNAATVAGRTTVDAGYLEIVATRA